MVIMGVPFFLVETVIVWHGQNVDHDCICDVLSACVKFSAVCRPVCETDYYSEIP